MNEAFLFYKGCNSSLHFPCGLNGDPKSADLPNDCRRPLIVSNCRNRAIVCCDRPGDDSSESPAQRSSGIWLWFQSWRCLLSCHGIEEMNYELWLGVGCDACEKLLNRRSPTFVDVFISPRYVRACRIEFVPFTDGSGPDAWVCDLTRESRFVHLIIVMMPIVRTPSPQYPLDLMKWQQNTWITIVILERWDVN
jgi:hypothetical protein